MVIGVNAADALFPGQNTDRRHAGAHGRLQLRIVGVLEKRKAGFFGENEEDNAVFIPFRTAQKVAPAKGYCALVIKAAPAKPSMKRCSSRKRFCAGGAT
jgi:hypothetical protein